MPGLLRLSFVRRVATTQLLCVVLRQMLLFPNLAIRDRHLQICCTRQAGRGVSVVVKIYRRCIRVSADRSDYTCMVEIIYKVNAVVGG